MKRRLIITDLAEQDALANHSWWATNRSEEQASRWLEGVYAKMWSLATTADRHAMATEDHLRRVNVKQASFGLGNRPTHRILYRIEEDCVVVFRVRAFKQDAIDASDLAEE